MNQSMQGVAPADSGNLYLQTVNYIALLFQADSAGGDATLSLADSLTNMHYGVTGGVSPVSLP